MYKEVSIDLKSTVIVEEYCVAKYIRLNVLMESKKMLCAKDFAEISVAGRENHTTAER